MSTTDDIPSSEFRIRSPELDVLNWPLVQDGWRSVFHISLTVGVAIVILSVSRSPACTAIGVVAMLIAMWRFWLPVRFQLSHAGIIQTCLRRRRLIPWRSVRRCDELRNGVLLFFSIDRSPLALLSTLYIAWRGKREPMLQLVENCTREIQNSHRSTTSRS